MKRKRILALVLSIAMCLTLCPLVTSADNAQIAIKMADTGLDGWNGAAINIYKDGTQLDTTATIESGASDTYTCNYDENSTYVFEWVKGEYDYECSFVISIAGEEVYTCDDGSTVSGIFYTAASSCEHEFEEGSYVCTNCQKTCGTAFSHSFDENHVCICGYTCGSEATPHDWSNKDGVCTVCGHECTHVYDKNYKCTVCQYSYKATVTSSDEDVKYYETLSDAFTAASSLSGSTVKLLDDVKLEDEIMVTSGSFKVDLNGKTVSSEETAFDIWGTSDVIFTDSSADGNGKVVSTNSEEDVFVYNLIIVSGTAKLTISGGTYENNFTYVISVSESGGIGNGNFVMTGGKLITTSSFAIEAWGSSVTVSGGIIESGKADIYFANGTLDFSGHSNPSGISILVEEDAPKTVSEAVNLPAGYSVVNSSGEAVTTFEGGKSYTIAKVEIVLEIDSEKVTVSGLSTSAVLVVASYSGDTLVDAKYFTVSADTKKTIKETLLSTTDADTLKAFLWDNMSDMTPLCDSDSASLK